jgi:hypothetical protein
MVMAESIVHSGIFTEIVNRRRSEGLFDFAYGEYLATKNFFMEISRLQEQIVKGEKFVISTGQEIDPETTGGMLAVQLFMEAMDSLRMAASGLAKAGLSAEKALWKNL